MKPIPCIIAVFAVLFVGIILIALPFSLGGLGSGQGENPGGATGAIATTSGDLTTSANGFNRNRVIEDTDFTNTSTMSTDQIQQFLKAKKSPLATYSEAGKTAAQIIFDGAQKFGINPQVIMVVLHKEQSLIGPDQSNLARRLRKAMGAACFDDGTCDARLFGFGRQVESGTAILRRWYDRAGTGKAGAFKVRQTVTIDGQSVTFENQATASLYKYTPHIVPDKPNFFNYFRDFFLRPGGA